MAHNHSGVAAAGTSHGVGRREATRVWALVGLNSFGGPAGQIAVMHRMLVDERRWLSEQRFLHALNYCMVLPGPEAQQLATYVGWLMHGVRGALVAGSLFVLPGFLCILALSVGYVTLGDVPAVSGLLFGLQAAVVAVVALAIVRLGRRAIRTLPLLFLAIGSFAALFFLGTPFPVVIAAAAAIGWAGGRLRPGWFGPADGPAARDGDAPARADEAAASLDDRAHDPRADRAALRAALACLALWLVPVAVLVAVLGTSHVLAGEALLFSKSAVLTFGGAYAVLGYIAQQAVSHGWLRPAEMLTGLGLAESTPGPLIMVVEFVGFVAAYRDPGALPPLVAGLLGATLTVWVTFLPSFLFIFLGAPFVERLRGNTGIAHALSAVTAAVVGVVCNLAVWFALHTWFGDVAEREILGVQLPVPDWSTWRWAAVAISVAAAVALLRLGQGMLRTLGIAAVAGMTLFLLDVPLG